MNTAVSELIATCPGFPRFKTVEGQGIPWETGAPSIQGTFPNLKNRVSKRQAWKSNGVQMNSSLIKKQVRYYKGGGEREKKKPTKRSYRDLLVTNHHMDRQNVTYHEPF